jgi:hypothetical protein
LSPRCHVRVTLCSDMGLDKTRPGVGQAPLHCHPERSAAESKDPVELSNVTATGFLARNGRLALTGCRSIISASEKSRD